MIKGKRNLLLGGIILSILIGEMLFSAIFSFYVIRILQVFLIINILFLKKFRLLLNGFGYYFYPLISFIILSLFYFSETLVSSEFYTIFWWFLFLSVINFEINTLEDLSYFLNNTSKFVFILTGIAAVFGFLKLFLIGQGVYLPQFELYDSTGLMSIIGGTSLNADYNIFAIGLYCGLFSGLYLYRELKSEKIKFLFSLVFILIVICAMLTGSRRGFVIGILLIPYLIWFSLNYSDKNKTNTNSLAFIRKKNIPWIAYLFILIFAFGAIKMDISSVIEASQDLTNVFDRVSTIETITTEDDSRSARWKFAFDYYYTLPRFNQIFGDGFEYIKLFTTYFDVDSYDYPHNVWISSLLYGGIIGLIANLILSIYVLVFYFKNRRIYKEIFFWYIFFLLLNFTSSNSIFSSRLFMVLLLVPFLNINQISKLKKYDRNYQ